MCIRDRLYIDDVRQRKQRTGPGIYLLPDNFSINIMLFADDQVILQEMESGLQKSVYQLSKICHECNLKTSNTKTKIPAFK